MVAEKNFKSKHILVVGDVILDCLVKGIDYELDEVVGKEFVESYGGKVVLVSILKGISSTRILEKIRGVYNV